MLYSKALFNIACSKKEPLVGFLLLKISFYSSRYRLYSKESQSLSSGDTETGHIIIGHLFP